MQEETHMDTILDMAKDLGYALQQDERYIRTQMAQAAADEDEALQGLIGEFNLKRIAINNENTKEEKDGEKLKRLDAELREVYARIMQNEHMAAYNEAKTELDKLVHAVGAIVTMSAQGQDPDEVQTGGCGGDCAGCAGCH
jgi:hypothetical protein